MTTKQYEGTSVDFSKVTHAECLPMFIYIEWIDGSISYLPPTNKEDFERDYHKHWLEFQYD